MTISTETYRVEYAGNGATTAFSTVFAFFANSDVVAILRTNSTGAEATWVEGTNYTLTGAGTEAAGTLTATVAPASGTTLVIYRDVPNTQPTSFPLGGDFPSDTTEDALDRIVMQIQKLAGDVAAALHYPTTDSPSLTSILPNSTTRASKFLAFDGTGAPIAAAGTSANLTPVSSFINTLLDDVDAATARATLGAGDVSTGSANVFTAAQTISLATAGNNLTATTTDAGATGSTIRNYHNTASPANADVPGRILFDGKDSGAADQTWARIQAAIVDVTAASENASLALATVEAGTLADRVTIGGTGGGMQIGAPTGGDKGSGTVNAASDYYYNNAPLPRGLAAAADMETATSTVLAVTPGLQQRHPGHPKAWVNYDNEGVAAILEDYGVTSVSDDAVGIFTVTVDTAFAAATYSMVGMVEQDSATLEGFLQKRFAGSGSYSTTQCTHLAARTDAADFDANVNGVCYYGDQ